MVGQQKTNSQKTVPIYGEMRSVVRNAIDTLPRHDRPEKDKHLFVWEDGSPIKDFRGFWEKACVSVDLPDLLFHDLRRSAVRNMIRAGVSDKVAMQISGHRTPAMLWRYDITDTRDLVEAGQANGEVFGGCSRAACRGIAETEVSSMKSSGKSSGLRPHRGLEVLVSYWCGWGDLNSHALASAGT